MTNNLYGSAQSRLISDLLDPSRSRGGSQSALTSQERLRLSEKSGSLKTFQIVAGERKKPNA